jgi:hypothetical protein
MSCGPPQRHDGPCYPSILSVSRDIRNEALPEWYTLQLQYQANVGLNGVEFLGHNFARHERLPLAFYSIKFLCLYIKLEWRPNRQRSFQNHITEMLPANTCLKRLEISLDIQHPRYVGLKGAPDELREALRRTLSPIQAITGLSKASVISHIIYPGSIDHSHPNSLAFILSSKELESVVREFFSEFATEEIITGAALQC